MTNLSRRSFLKTSTAAATLTIALSNTPHLIAQATQGGHVTPCLRVDESGNITVCVPIPDMGQGMITTAAQMIAEELSVNLDDVNVELMPFIGHTNDQGRAEFGRFYQGAGGSGSTARIWYEMRRTAAYAKTLLLETAARQWRVPRASLEARNGEIIETYGTRKASYAAFVSDANGKAHEIFTNGVETKPVSKFRVIGKDQRNVEARKIVTGDPIFGLDADVPDMLHAVIKRCPYLNGTMVSYDDTAAKAVPGVRGTMAISRSSSDGAQRTIAAGVAVIADSLWQAKKAAELLDIQWDGSISVDDSSTTIHSKCIAQTKDGSSVRTAVQTGDIDAAFEQATNTIDVTYDHPTWAHTCLEPHSCIAHVDNDKVEIWVSHQFMDSAINAAAGALNISADNVKANFYRMGTGFGRKAEGDFVIEACIIAKEFDAPIKVTWSREDEMEQDYPNHMGAYRVRAATDEQGKLSAWHIRTALDTGNSTIARLFPSDNAPNVLAEGARIPNNISRGAWRGPSHNTGAWVIQSALSEAAYSAGLDPLDFMTALYNDAGTLKSPTWPYHDVDYRRHSILLRKAAKEAGYGKEMPDGWGQGIAVHHTFVSACAHVVDLEMIGDNDYRVHKVTSAIDCGLAVNPLGIRAQVESGIMDGLCAAKYGKLVFEAGVPITNNFDTYQKMRIDEAPPIVNIHIMDFGDTEPRGTGEVSLPPIIPALTNAIFAASGKRIRSLPISENL
ncbi:xanthine dehydrogenase family protein molybdopterin-binding subunit [Kordiimonas aquimaris]|uniref:xanthine dehydrogenase family protein molybdopterin-binding subunit n=1 Tax=Kordiimonas aquimaris TaxID=707591 RepID=UPI0021CE8669|nr:molybdopterin cofactor-binding domain-containing protein [Kordiimonas aquimaris]